MLDALEATGGIYVAIFVVAIISGVFPLVNSELTLTGIALAGASTPKLLVLAAIIAAGQTVTHTTLYVSGREVARLGSTRRAKLQARIERGRALVARWGDRSLLVLFSASTLGLPPMMLVALVSGALGIRFRSFVVIGLVGRVLRFAAIALAASLV